jgi:hypothetical protein
MAGLSVGGRECEAKELTASGDGGGVGDRKKDCEETKEGSKRYVTMHLSRLSDFL